MNDKEKLISLLILTDPNPYTCESESGSCELTTCTECRARSTADLLIENGVTVQEWISVDDRLPDKTGKYLAVKKRIAPDDFGGNRTDIVIIRFFVDDGFRMPIHIPDWINKKINEEVTHWMPIPEIPKGE